MKGGIYYAATSVYANRRRAIRIPVACGYFLLEVGLAGYFSLVHVHLVKAPTPQKFKS